MKYVIGNLKMNLLSPLEREKYFIQLDRELDKLIFKNTTIIICPPAVHIEAFGEHYKKNRSVKIGAQNVFWEVKGSYTGEISPLMAKSTGAVASIVGHSERRLYFSETDDIINQKIKICLKNSITPIFCIGETKMEKQMGRMKNVIMRQLQEGLRNISRMSAEKIIFVYEPVWSVGTDKVPNSNEIMEARLLIRKILSEKYGMKFAMKAVIIYGGSVNSNIVSEVCISPGMDGVLVGRESLVPHEFIKIAAIINNECLN
jgi:triosephosphate isomerase (TIM)